MKSKKILLIILIIIIAVTAVYFYFQERLAATWNKKPEPAPTSTVATIKDVTINDNTNPFVIKITYPQIAGLDDFNQKAKAIAEKEISTFKTDSLANDEAVKKVDPESYAKYPRTYELDIGYDKGEINNDATSVVFNIYNFEGGAHGASYFVPLNYDVKNKKEIKLSDLFPNQPNYLQKISDYCIAELTKQITAGFGAKLEKSETDWIKEGAGPKAENFSNFLINSNNTITFYFQQYQVAAGAAGDFKVIFPR